MNGEVRNFFFISGNLADRALQTVKIFIDEQRLHVALFTDWQECCSFLAGEIHELILLHAGSFGCVFGRINTQIQDGAA